MDIKRIGENKIRCALTEEEIQELGFEIDDIIGNGETTQQFMRVILERIEEQENISMENISPMVKAEILQNHTMAITFGGDNDVSIQSLMETMNHIMSQIEPAKFEELKKIAKEEKEATKEKKKLQSGKMVKSEPLICALRFANLSDMSRMCRVCFPDRLPKSSLYKMDGKYYLILNFNGFNKIEMRPFAFGTVEYDEAHYSDVGQIAHIKEQGVCIAKSEAIEMLMQL